MGTNISAASTPILSGIKFRERGFYGVMYAITTGTEARQAIQTGTAARVYAPGGCHPTQHPDAVAGVGRDQDEKYYTVSSAGEVLGKLREKLDVGDGMMFEVTIRNRFGEKIARRIQVDESATIAEVIEEARHKSQLAKLLDRWHTMYGNRRIEDWWLVNHRVKVQKQEPVKFDVLVDNHSV